ncbi:MAG: hypothetical protein GY838_09380 [bacterium]|nr:hypothetical protein [bacterium]
MAVEFCEHLEDYGNQYTVAEAAYRQMLGRLDVVMREDRGDQQNVELLEDAVEEWEREVRYLRDLFLIYVRRGDVELPAPGEGGATPDPVCGICGELVSRLCWQEWRVQGGGANYRGAPFLTAPEPEAEPAAV